MKNWKHFFLLQILQAELEALLAEQAELDETGDAYDLPAIHCPALQAAADSLRLLHPVCALYQTTKVNAALIVFNYFVGSC